MSAESYKHGEHRRLQLPLGANQQYAWKERTYAVPTPSRKGFQWKASALRSLERLNRTHLAGHPVTVVVPALYNAMPAEAIALGWFNEIDALHTIRHRIMACGKLTGWDVFTAHTQHNLDNFYDSTIRAVRQTWLHEGSLTSECVTETVRRFGRPYEYHRLQARLVENLVFQSSIMEWLTARATDVPFRFHVIGTALLSALVWSGAAPFITAARTALKIGTRWDAHLAILAEDELMRNKTERTDDNLGWLRFNRVRQLVEGHNPFSLAMPAECMPQIENPIRPFWFSANSEDEPVMIATVRDAEAALASMNLSSWAPVHPKALADDQIRGWLVSSMHPMATASRWSVYNYLLATPSSALLFVDHIAALGRAPMMAMTTTAATFSKPFPSVQNKVIIR